MPPLKPTRIVAIDDDPGVLAALRECLSESHGFALKTFNEKTRIDELIRYVDVEKPDLILLDQELGIRLKGTDILRQLREHGVLRPVIFLSAVLELEAEVFKLSAEDFVGKPFKPDALRQRIITRIANHVKMTSSMVSAHVLATDPDFTFCSCRVSPGQCRISTLDGEISESLTNLQLGVIGALWRARGRVVTRQELLSVWEWPPSDKSRVLDNTVYEIREKIRKLRFDKPFLAEKHILTVKAQGFRYNPVVETSEQTT